MMCGAVGLGLGCGGKAPAPAPGGTSSACTIPTTMASSNEQTAWQLFVAASCTSNGHLGWEAWTEQSCLSNPGSCTPPGAAAVGPHHHLHASRLREKVPGRSTAEAGLPTNECSKMTTVERAREKQPSLEPFVPTNLSKDDPRFCEEVFVNSDEVAFVRAPASNATLTTLTGQVQYASQTPIKFPTTSLEVKADWLPAKSLDQASAFDCADHKPAGVYTETIDGVCYALVGVHISSKLLPNWLWATFEPQSTITNPNRCNPALYSNCNDPWGSNPATSNGPRTEPTAALSALIASAGLPKELLNYRLVGAQSSYVDGSNQPILLGSSFVEFNAEVPPHQASCITCHAYAMVNNADQANPNFGAFPGTPAVGTPGNPPAGNTWYPLDFSWMLAIMPTK